MFPVTDVADRLAAETRRIVLRELADVPERPLVLLSGGVDSQLVLRGLLDLGKRPEALSFALEGQPSTDLRLAQETCEGWEVGHYTLWLSRDPAELGRYVRWAVDILGLRKKVDIECFWPRYHALRYAAYHEYAVVATGDGGDGHFGVSRKAMVHYRDTVEKLDEFRHWYFDRDNPAQTRTIAEYAEKLRIQTVWPLRHPDLIEAFLGTSWDEVNRPRQKEPFRRAFDLPNLPKHANLQGGDSGIADAFNVLAPEGKTARTVYNQMIREVESGQETLDGFA